VTVKILPSYEAVSDQAFALVAERIRTYPNSVLGLATGSTPIGLYKRLAAAALDWSRIITFNLDEYIGLSIGHPKTYLQFMWDHLFEHVNIDPSHTYFPLHRVKGGAEYFEKSIQYAGGIDLQILGIGGNGHIGFNEPGSPLDSRTRRVALAPRTVADNARFFNSPDGVPRHAITMGIATIMDARSILLMACGKNKATAISRALTGPVTADIPASALQKHPNVHVILDEAAASELDSNLLRT